MELLTYWPWIAGYILIGLICMGLVEFYRGKTHSDHWIDISRDTNLQMLAQAMVWFWPFAIGLAIAAGVMLVIALPLIGMSKLCYNFGIKRRVIK